MFVMDKRYETALLFDFYGELLTEKQREIYRDVMMEDYSLSEVAGSRGISRQGVHDMIRRCGTILAGYESKLGLVKKFIEIRKRVEDIRNLTSDEEIKRLADEILEEL